MPTVCIAPFINNAQFNNGQPLVGGKWQIYRAGTTTPITVYTDSTGTVANTNPVILNARGEPTAPIWLDIQDTIDAYLLTPLDAQLRVLEDLRGINAVTSNTVSYTPAGTGAVATSVQAKLRQTVSVEDFGAVGDGVTNDRAAFQLACDWVASLGGGTVLANAHSYSIVGSVALASYVHVSLGVTTLIDCGNSSTACFTATGSIDTGVPLAANVTTGATTITTTTAHGLSVGDTFLLKSQRVCLESDATAQWQLGGTTVTVASPYFTEPCKVVLVNSTTSVDIQSGLIFPTYRIDRTLETQGTALYTTIIKLNAVQKPTITGGRFIRSSVDDVQIIKFVYCYDALIDIGQCQLGSGPGVGVYLQYCLACNVKASAIRPPEWTLGAYDHSQFNSFKDVSSWYNKYDLRDENGSQGFDQTYSSNMYCSIGTQVKMYSIDSHESGGTTHGGVYGFKGDFTVINSKTSAFSNRARFSDITLKATNCAQSSVGNLILMTWGMMDTIVHDCVINGGSYGIDFQHEVSTDISPPECNLIIDNVSFTQITSQLINIRSRTLATLISSNISIRNITAVDCVGPIFVGTNWNNINISNVSYTRGGTSGSACVVRVSDDCGGIGISNIVAIDIPAGSCVVRCDSPKVATNAVYTSAAFLDGTTIKRFGIAGSVYNFTSSPPYYTSAAGTWMPTFTGVTNSAPNITGQTDWFYSVTGDILSFSGSMRTVAAATALCETSITLPPTIIANVATGLQIAGVGSTTATAASRHGSCVGNATTETINFTWSATAADDKTFKVTGMMTIIR